MELGKKHIPITMILLIALAFHLYLLLFGRTIELSAPDEIKYIKMAETFIEENYYSYQGQGPDAYVTPGHPFYLVSIFMIADFLNVDKFFLTAVFNMMLNLLTIFFVYMISERLFHNRIISILAAVLFLVTIPQYHYFKKLLTETPGSFTLYLAILLFIMAFQENKTKWHILFGFAAAVSLMVRPTPAPMLLLAFGLVLYKYKWREGIRIGLLWWVGPLFLIFPWIIRNYLVFQQLHIFSSHAGNPMLLGTDPFYQNPSVNLAKEARELGLSYKEYAKQRIVEGLKNDPVLWISWFTLGKTLWMFREPDHLYRFHFSSFMNAMFYIHHFFILITGTISAYFLRKNNAVAGLVGIIFIYIAVSNVFLPLTRYGQYIIPLFCILSAVGIYHLFKSLQFGVYDKL
ncbi:ArnT family glycosyltransferase [Salirhabdus salicampi]|uniref:ArnT family glycosyltransferase n=1 Tax=Salirhabdus salicampi TaxID=476102 RepID=UPI0020C5A814|nr:glycosyltransferase family 39 protein [Salirhabdus salicampi]MCP8615835.1 glycosyltransferase family 39 protein [Salirhabdus salicampi]